MFQGAVKVHHSKAEAPISIRKLQNLQDRRSSSATNWGKLEPSQTALESPTRISQYRSRHSSYQPFVYISSRNSVPKRTVSICSTCQSCGGTGKRGKPTLEYDAIIQDFSDLSVTGSTVSRQIQCMSNAKLIFALKYSICNNNCIIMEELRRNVALKHFKWVVSGFGNTPVFLSKGRKKHLHANFSQFLR